MTKLFGSWRLQAQVLLGRQGVGWEAKATMRVPSLLHNGRLQTTEEHLPTFFGGDPLGRGKLAWFPKIPPPPAKKKKLPPPHHPLLAYTSHLLRSGEANARDLPKPCKRLALASSQRLTSLCPSSFDAGYFIWVLHVITFGLNGHSRQTN